MSETFEQREERWARERWECLANRVCQMERDTRGEGEAFLTRWKFRHGSRSAQKLRELMRQAWRQPFPEPGAKKPKRQQEAA